MKSREKKKIDKIEERVVSIFRDFPNVTSWVRYHWINSLYLHDDERWPNDLSQFVDWDKYASVALTDSRYGVLHNNDGTVTILHINPK